MFKQIRNTDFLKLGQTVLAGTVLAATLMAPFSAFATALPGSNNCSSLIGVRCDSTSSPVTLIIQVLNIMLGVAFMIAVLFLVIGGFRYIFSAGNEETAEKGRKTVINALIGIAIIILSFVIVQIVNKTVANSQSSSLPFN